MRVNSKILPVVLVGAISLLATGCSSAPPKTDSEAITRACESYYKAIKESDGGESTLLGAIDLAKQAQELSSSDSDKAVYRELVTELNNVINYYDPEAPDPGLIGAMGRAESICSQYAQAE